VVAAGVITSAPVAPAMEEYLSIFSSLSIISLLSSSSIKSLHLLSISC
jgi:hypothetical protein